MKKYIFGIVILLTIILINTAFYVIITMNQNKKLEAHTEPDTKHPETKERPTIKKVKKIDENTYLKLDYYEDLKNLISNIKIKIPVNGEFIPQGLTRVQDNLLLSGYYDSKINSRIFIIDESGNTSKSVELDTNSHVGAISYDNKNKLLWGPGNEGVLYAYDIKDVFQKNKIERVYKFDNLALDFKNYFEKEKNAIDYLNYDDGYLFIGNFQAHENSKIKKYKIQNKSKKTELDYCGEFYVPSKVQGLTFIEYNKTKYMILSRSYNRFKKSEVIVYEYKDGITDYNNLELKTITTPPLQEQIAINDEHLLILFESNANKYKSAKEKMEYLLEIDIDKLLNF